MTMKSSLNYCLLSTIALFFILLHLLSPSSNTLNHQHLSSIPRRGLLQMEEKTRLGSRPPSCWNKCNSCHPCMAVQVPTLPNQNKKNMNTKSITIPMDYLNPLANGYTNYKPLGWKCRCKNHLYNP